MPGRSLGREPDPATQGRKAERPAVVSLGPRARARRSHAFVRDRVACGDTTAGGLLGVHAVVVSSLRSRARPARFLGTIRLRTTRRALRRHAVNARYARA